MLCRIEVKGGISYVDLLEVECVMLDKSKRE